MYKRQAQHSARRLAGINASHLSDYLVDEVLDNVDARTRNFLLKSSLLRSMNDALIVRVTGEENGQMQLEEIERQGLFLQRMDDSGEWFRYHPLFGSFLDVYKRQHQDRDPALYLTSDRRFPSSRGGWAGRASSPQPLIAPGTAPARGTFSLHHSQNRAPYKNRRRCCVTC